MWLRPATNPATPLIYLVWPLFDIPPHIRGYRQKLDEKAWFIGIPLMDYYDDQPMDYIILTKTLVFPNTYPLVNVYIVMENHIFFKAKSTIICHIQVDSIAM